MTLSDALSTALLEAADSDLPSLWWVRSDVWIKAFEDIDEDIEYKSKKPHPALASRLLTPETYDLGTQPALHGRTDPSDNSFQVLGFNRNNPNYVTHFGHLLSPVLLQWHWFTWDTFDRNLYHWEPRARVVRNHRKPHLTPVETEAFRAWWQRRRDDRK